MDLINFWPPGIFSSVKVVEYPAPPKFGALVKSHNDVCVVVIATFLRIKLVTGVIYEVVARLHI
jgi:hypothetical protein